MQKIIFSTSYDSNTYKSYSTNKSRYIGPLGLLSILERELGIYDIYSNEEKRLDSYKKCLQDNAKSFFFEEVLEKDSINVAKELLNLRDGLIMLGWNYKNVNQPTRFSDLALVEKAFIKSDNYVGISDRWRIVLENISVDKLKEFDIEEIVLHDDKKSLHPFFKELFSKLSEIVSEYKFNPNNKNNNLSIVRNAIVNSVNNTSSDIQTLKNIEEDKSITILNFKNKQLAEDTIAYYSEEHNNIVVNNDNLNFDFSLVSFGKSASGSVQQNCNSQLIQLFKLVTVCFTDNINIQTILSLLQLQNSPIDYKLSSKLAKSISRYPGIDNDEWNIIIEKYLSEEKLNEEEVKRRKTIVKLFLTFGYENDDKSIKKALKLYKYLVKWIESKIAKGVGLEIKEQFIHLNNLCKNAIVIIKDKTVLSESISEINNIYSTKSFANYYKQQKSIDVIGNVSNIASECDKEVYWLDFYNSSINTKYNDSFLYEEKQYLKDNFSYYNSENQIELVQHQWLKGLNFINNKLILCTISGTKEKHPLLIRMETLIPDLDKIKIEVNSVDDVEFISRGDLVESEIKNLPTPQYYLQSDVIKNIKPRHKESASSIEKFIEYPFDWVMKYVAKFEDNMGLELPSINLIKGNVAHKTIEKLFNRIIEKNNKSLEISKDEFNEELDNVLRQQAYVFLEKEHRFELSEFRFTLYKSFKSLIDIINTNKLSLKSCEYKFGWGKDLIVDEALGKLLGSIDLLLEDYSNNPFIIDLKWTFSDKKYKEKIEKGEAIQLALYSASINKRELSRTAYFMLNQNVLITSSSLKGKNIHHIPVDYDNQDVLDKLKFSLEYRWKQIKNGDLEIADGLPLKELEYHVEVGTLPLSEGIKKTKKSYPYSGYNLFKGTLK